MSAEKLDEKQQGRRRFSLRTKPEAAPQPEVNPAELKGMTAKKGRATPSRRRREEEEEDEGNVLQRTGGGLAEYVEGVRSEVRKVVWPTREEARRLTVIVLVTLIISSIVLGLISLGFTELFRIGLNSPLVLFVFMFIAIAVGLFVYRRSNTHTTQF